MATYKCTNSCPGYAYGQTIDSYVYGSLPLSQQGNFRKEDDYSSSNNSSSSMIDNVLRGDITGSGIYGGLDMDPSTLI